MMIQQLNQETGIGIDTLRVWERLYGFPLPQHDASGHRSYSQHLLEELRFVKSLQGFGLRPGEIFSFQPVTRVKSIRKNF